MQPENNTELQSQILAASVESGKGMGGAAKTAGEDSAMSELFKLNQVHYRMPPSLSLVSKRTITRTQFQQTSYSNLAAQVATVNMNTGEFYVSPSTSFLVIAIGIDKSALPAGVISRPAQNAPGYTPQQQDALSRGACSAYLGYGGIRSIFEEVIFTSASGTEVDRQQNKGLQAAALAWNMKSLDYFSKAGALEGLPGPMPLHWLDGSGYPGTAAGANAFQLGNRDYDTWELQGWWRSVNNGGAAMPNSVIMNQGQEGIFDISFDSVQEPTFNPIPGNAKTFIIPMSEILGCFSPYMRALFPSAALAGARMDFRFKNPVESLIASGPPLVSTANATAFLNALQISNIYINWDCFQLNDSVLRRLNEVAAGTAGLTVMFDTWDWANTNVQILTFEAQVSQARSRILRSFCVLRDYGEKTNPWSNSLASEAMINRVQAYTESYVNTNAPGTGQIQCLVNNYQAQLGALYFPQQPLTSVEEYLMNSYYLFGKNYFNSDDCGCVGMPEFVGATGNGHFGLGGGGIQASQPSIPSTVGINAGTQPFGTNAFFVTGWSQNWGSGVLGFLAERSQLLQLTGLPISNARLLRHRFVLNYGPASTLGRQIDVFTHYTKVMKVFLGGRIVMRE